jgi:hypothetical protein
LPRHAEAILSRDVILQADSDFRKILEHHEAAVRGNNQRRRFASKYRRPETPRNPGRLGSPANRNRDRDKRSAQQYRNQKKMQLSTPRSGRGDLLNVCVRRRLEIPPGLVFFFL